MKKKAYIRMAYIPACKFGEEKSSILFRIDRSYVDLFFEKLDANLSKLKNKTRLGIFHNNKDCPVGISFLFGFNIFGFRHGEAWFSENFFNINIGISSVGIIDSSLTLAVLFRLVNEIFSTQADCLKMFSPSGVAIKDKRNGYRYFGKCPVDEIPEERSERLLLPAVISESVLFAMSDAWKILADGYVKKPHLSAAVYGSGDFVFHCPARKIENYMVRVTETGTLAKIKFDVTKNVQKIVLYSATAQLCESVYKDIYHRIK